MLIKDGSVWTWRATIRVNSFDLDGNLIDVVEFPNLITNVGKNLVRDSFDGGVTDLAIKYMGWGTSSTAPAAGQTTLVAESGRKAVTSQADGAAGIIDTTVYLGPDANETSELCHWNVPEAHALERARGDLPGVVEDVGGNADAEQRVGEGPAELRGEEESDDDGAIHQHVAKVVQLVRADGE